MVSPRWLGFGLFVLRKMRRLENASYCMIFLMVGSILESESESERGNLVYVHGDMKCFPSYRICCGCERRLLYIAIDD